MQLVPEEGVGSSFVLELAKLSDKRKLQLNRLRI